MFPARKSVPVMLTLTPDSANAGPTTRPTTLNETAATNAANLLDMGELASSRTNRPLRPAAPRLLKGQRRRKRTQPGFIDVDL